MLAEAASGSMTMPYQMLAVDPFCAWKLTGFAAVPLTSSVPLMVSSTREVSSPEICPSLLASCTVVPAWIVSVDPTGTMASPCTM